MRTTQRWMVLLVLVALSVFSACTGNGLDDGDAADVVLEVVGLQTTPITGQVDVGQCAVEGNPCLSADQCNPVAGNFCDIDISGDGCQVTNWSLQLRNVPVSELAATSPFNDIVVREIDAQYRDSQTGTLLWERIIPITCTIQPGQVGTCAFSPVSFDDLNVDNTTLNIVAVARGATVAGDQLSTAFGAQLNIEACLTPIP